MVLDTSALVAVLFDEPDRHELVRTMWRGDATARAAILPD